MAQINIRSATTNQIYKLFCGIFFVTILLGILHVQLRPYENNGSLEIEDIGRKNDMDYNSSSVYKDNPSKSTSTPERQHGIFSISSDDKNQDETKQSEINQDGFNQEIPVSYGYEEFTESSSNKNKYTATTAPPVPRHIIWKPLISLHSIKHIYNNSIPSEYAKEKLGNFTMNVNSEILKSGKQYYKEARDLCPLYFQETFFKKIVFPNFYGGCSKQYNPHDISLLIQMDTSHGYYDKLYTVSRYWTGPISVALYINASYYKDNVNFNNIYLHSMMENIFATYRLQKSALCVHIVTSHKELTFYPVNTLRNVATKYAPTSLVLLIEADFIPMPGMHEIFANKNILKHNLLKKKMAYVIPSFAIQNFNVSVPLNKTELLYQWQHNITLPIHFTKTFKTGHQATDYKKYRYADRAYKVKWAPNYEPYYIIHREQVPYYPEEFLHGYRDKSVHAYMLRVAGFKFYVLPNTYIVHTPHAIDYTRETSLYICAAAAYKDFVKEYVNLVNPTPPPTVDTDNSEKAAKFTW